MSIRTYSHPGYYLP